MKKSIILIGLLFASQLGMSQGLEVRTYVEKTHIGTKVGTSVGRQTNASHKVPITWEYGAFYQEASSEATFPDEVETERTHIEKEFYGIYGGLVVKNGGLVNVRFNVRTGVSNGENFVITPSVQGHLKLMRKIRVGGGVGVRSFRPTYQGSITVIL